ncbi:hypothetical protein BU24DRAFT_428738, partial [Aaosphaeria arxii CBS 175.79]
MIPQQWQSVVDHSRRPPSTSTPVVPRSPRALRSQLPQRTSLSLLESLQAEIGQLETRKLYPRLSLYRALTEFKSNNTPRRSTGDQTRDSRRTFLDSFSYLCDVKKGGGTVRAAALQSLDLSDILWLAANEGIVDSTLAYAKTILRRLQAVSTQNRKQLQDTIFELAVVQCSHRVQYYKGKVQNYAKWCRIALKHVQRDDNVQSLRRAFRKLSEPGPNMEMGEYIKLCYEMRSAGNGIYQRTKEASENEGDDFSNLAHYIWRLGATRAHANSVVESMIAVPSLQRISEIRTLAPPTIDDKTIHPDCHSPHEILQDIFAETNSYNPLQAKNAFMRLFELDPPRQRPIRQKVVSYQPIRTRVHAELQLADMFSRSKNMMFVDNDKYIGCSKPACYFCYNWLYSKQYVRPATHYKIIVGCRGPDHDLNANGAIINRDMYSKIIRQIDQDIIDFLGRESTPRRHQFMSTEASSQTTSM